jgi:hypothetical protein
MRRIRRHAFPIQLIALLAMVLGPAAAAIGFPCATHRGAAGAASACCYGSSQMPLSGPCCSVLKTNAAIEPSGCAGHPGHAAQVASSETGLSAVTPQHECFCAPAAPSEFPAAVASAPTAGRALKWALPDGPTVLSPSVSAPSLERSACLPAADRLLPGPQCDSRPDAGRAPPIA